MIEDPVHSMFARYHGLDDYCVPPWISNPALQKRSSRILWTNDTRSGCMDCESDEEETELETDEEDMGNGG